jgi:undecaprenyl-diphosphatase
MTKLAGEGSRYGTSLFGRVGDVSKRPPVWAAIAGVIAVSGPRAHHAAVRGGVSYLAAAVAHLPVKLIVARGRPPGAHRYTVTSSFPSGHCASELAFSIGAAQEIPWLIVPLYAATVAAEWSMVRSQAHYPSDIFAGAAVSIVVALVAQKVWPPHRVVANDEDAT